jgi:hypothetical protein
MITKIDDHEIERHTNIEIFLKDYDNRIESEIEQIIKLNSQSQ